MSITATANDYRIAQSVPRRMTRQFLSVPLLTKIIGANAIIVVAGFAYLAIVGDSSESASAIAMSFVMIAASIVNVALVRIALRPLNDLQMLAHRVSTGDFDARGQPSPFADAELHALGSTINGLLDSLAAERVRINELGREVIYAQDRERARVARELHDSIAQTLAGAKFQIAAAGNGANTDVKNRLAAVSAMIGSVTDEIRNVSYSLHPRVAEDLGLESALNALAGQIKERSNVGVTVSVTASHGPIASNVAGTLYRVAEEALKNIEMHSRAKNATVEVFADGRSVRIVISDDGQGFDAANVGISSRRSGLASMKDRVVLAGGSMKIDSKPNGGTCVMAELQTPAVAI